MALPYNRKGQDFAAPTEAHVKGLRNFAKNEKVPAPIRHGITEYLNANEMTFDDAGAIIGMLTDWVERLPTTKVTETGIYMDRATGDFYQVKRSGKGYLYALVLNIVSPGKRSEDGEWEYYPKFEWLFAKGAIYRISSNWRITPEEAKQFGDYFPPLHQVPYEADPAQEHRTRNGRCLCQQNLTNCRPPPTTPRKTATSSTRPSGTSW
jgi:hypothetical protein